MSYDNKQTKWKFLGTACFLTAIIQWLAIINRIGAAAWQYYKFQGYSNDGHIIVNQDTQVFFFTVSLLVIVISYVSWTILKKSGWRFSRVAQVALYMLAGGTITWGVVSLLTPLVVIK